MMATLALEQLSLLQFPQVEADAAGIDAADLARCRQGLLFISAQPRRPLLVKRQQQHCGALHWVIDARADTIYPPDCLQRLQQRLDRVNAAGLTHALTAGHAQQANQTESKPTRARSAQQQ